MTQALKEINETGALSKNMQQVLRKNSDEFLRELDQIVKRVGNAELSSLEALTLKQAKMVQQALEDLSHGKGVTARVISESIDEMDGAIRKTEQILQEHAQRCKTLTTKIGEVGDGGLQTQRLSVPQTVWAMPRAFRVHRMRRSVPRTIYVK